jgi:hypothetical protein
MEKLFKLFVSFALFIAFAYAQTVDTTVAKDSSQTVTASTVVKKATTGTRPGKPPTNWSKIKDLFL